MYVHLEGERERVDTLKRFNVHVSLVLILWF